MIIRNDTTENNQKQGQQNASDTISKVLGLLPDFAMRIVVWMLLWMDKVGIMPRFIEKASPWHSSVFLTNIGSIGVESIYHHLSELFRRMQLKILQSERLSFHKVLYI
jgi:hypothetical protein